MTSAFRPMTATGFALGIQGLVKVIDKTVLECVQLTMQSCVNLSFISHLTKDAITKRCSPLSKQYSIEMYEATLTQKSRLQAAFFCWSVQ